MDFSLLLELVSRAISRDSTTPDVILKGLQRATELIDQGVDPFAAEEGSPDETITIPVDSSCLALVQYKPTDEELRVLFKQSGNWYSYSGVAPEAVEQLVEAESVGREYNDSIRDDYPYQRES